ncbi:ribosome recycling factor [Promineifilum sp.]|uniref:ribosome recycling factor n=1 Tax=Promineifilum sp. TaxID=2664178 RepID=UPI0035AF9078
MIADVMREARNRMNGAITSLESDLGAFRTGRASTKLVEHLKVEQYGMEMQLNQMAVISVPEPQQLAIRPYDRSSLSVIEKAIMKSDLGIMPNNDGQVIRLNIPRLTEERRRDLTRIVGRRVEEAKVAVRNIRRDLNHDLKELKDEKLLAEDDFTRGEKQLQEITDKFISQIEDIGRTKEAEIMEV